MTSETLKPCPFCEGEAQMIPRAMPASVRYYVECEECGCSQLTHRLEADAITEWNTRTDDTADLLAALRPVFAHFGDDVDAPGHRHMIPGVWNQDSGKAGKTCGWCAQWQAAHAAIARAGV